VTEPSHSSEHDPLLDEALDWVIQLKAGEPTRDDVEALRRWRGQSSLHEEAFKSAVRLWRFACVAAQELEDEGRRRRSAVSQFFSVATPRRAVMSRRFALGGMLAACSAGYIAVHPPFGLWPSLDELSADYRTARGERRKVALAPDVSMELNTLTSIAIKPAKAELQIELISGEAMIASRASSSRGLTVHAAGGRITAMVADFNARCSDGMVSVTCLGGAVNVQKGQHSVRIGHNEQVSYSDSGLTDSIFVDSAQVTAWRSGRLIFRGVPLAEVVDEVNRYRPGKIIITNADLSRRVVDGVFQLDRLEHLIGQIQNLFGARAMSLPGGIVLLS
jgi:transmembrane sensor